MESGDRRNDRIRSGGHDDVLGAVADAVDLDRAGAGEPARATEQVNATLGQPPHLARVCVLGDHEVTPGECRRDVDRGRCSHLARTVHRLAGPQKRLRRNASP